MAINFSLRKALHNLHNILPIFFNFEKILQHTHTDARSTFITKANNIQKYNYYKNCL